MNYLSITNNPLDNLNLITQGIVVTKEYSDALDERNKKDFEPKIRALNITTLALAILSTLFATVISLPAGLLVGTVAVLSGCVLFYQKDRQQFHQSKLNETMKTVNDVFENIIKFVDEQVSKKEAILINAYKPRLAPSKGLETTVKQRNAYYDHLREQNTSENEIRAIEALEQEQIEKIKENEKARERKAGSKICSLEDAEKDLVKIEASFDNCELDNFDEKNAEFITSYQKLTLLCKQLVDLQARPALENQSRLWQRLTNICNNVLNKSVDSILIHNEDGQWKAISSEW